jgi:hypothetical protein
VTPEEFAQRAATLPAALVHATPPAVRAGGSVLEDEARGNLRTASGGDLRLSRVRSGKGAKVDVKLTTRGSGTGAQALVLPVGPVSLVEGDTRGHVQPFQYLATRSGGARSYSMNRRRRAVRARAMNIPGVGWRTYVKHPGTRGKHPVSRAMAGAGARAGEAGADVFARAIRDHLT